MPSYSSVVRTHKESPASPSTALVWVSENGAFKPQTLPTNIDLSESRHGHEGIHHPKEALVNELQSSPGYEFVCEAEKVNSCSKATMSQSSYRYDAMQCFHCNYTHRVIICKEHGYAVASWKRHVLDFYAFTRTETKDIGRSLRNLDVVRPEDALTPPPDGLLIQHLQRRRVGFRCRGIDGEDRGHLRMVHNQLSASAEAVLDRLTA